MKRQKRQFLILVLVIVAALIVFFVLKQKNEQAAKEEEAKSQEMVLDEIDSALVTAFSYYVNGQQISFERIEETWSCVQDRELEIDADKINSLLENVAQITANEELLDVENLEEYGLLEPTNTITIVCNDKTICYEIGNYNEVVDGYYVKRRGETTIYLVNGAIATAFTEGVDSFIVEETVSENTVSDNTISDNVITMEETEK